MTNSAKPTRRTHTIRIRKHALRDPELRALDGAQEIPRQNVVDLRALFAERELVRARKRRAEAMRQPAPRRKSLFFRRRGTTALPSLPSLQEQEQKSLPALPQAEKLPVEQEAPRIPEDIFADIGPREEHDDTWITLAPPSSSQQQTGHERPSLPSVFSADEELPLVHVSVHTIWKPLLIFCSLAVLFVLPASVSAMLRKTQTTGLVIQSSAEGAFAHLEQGAMLMKEFQFRAAQEEFAEAGTMFDDASRSVRSVNALLAAVAPYVPGKGKEFASGRNLLFAGSELAIAGEHIAEAFALVTKLQHNTASLLAPAEDSNSAPTQELTSSLVLLHSALFPAIEHVNAAADYLADVDPDALPAEKRDVIRDAQQQLPLVQYTLIDSVDLVEMFLTILGHDHAKRYLVLFQNNHELRPTGGFIGSLALLDIEKGVVTGLDVPAGGVYDVAGQFTKNIIAPTPLHLVNPSWNLQDANWFPHFPASAQKIQWFYEHSRGPSVDGVITLIPRVVEELLRLTGPIDMTEDFGTVIDADNFYDEFQTRAEEKFDATRESKKIIGAMLPLLLQRVVAELDDPERVIALVQMFQEFLDAKDILMSMNDPLLERQIASHGWNGEFISSDRDYLAVVHANIAGGKTDSVIDNVITHEAVIADDGAITNTVTLTRVHRGSVRDPLTNIKNTDYVRFYVPKGSIVVSAEGFQPPDASLFFQPDADAVADADLRVLSGDVLVNEATHVATNTEFGKLVIGGWIQTPVGASSTVKITYRLPFRITVGGLWQTTDRYSLLVQKQPGSVNTVLRSDVRVPATMRQGRAVPDDFQGHTQRVLDSDFYAGFVLEAR